MNMRTPLSIISGLGSIRGGTSHFWRQRLTALANVPLSLFLVWLVIQLAGADRFDLVVALGNPLVATLLVLTIISFTWHMCLGVQMVIEDYTHSEGLKIILLILNNFIGFMVAAISVVAVLKMSFGG
ncbi:Succinate dehydrogenase hydrophobic membrane anchor protein [hydrothermal vent metagenome]|uniref:Succinate dehydrogenase hydrophobic membrane anchor protein n=1 Tax=hydrothermal vent metagenome TaxID=652676 RepID=A0A3B0UBQ9_9ZZZZ